SSGRLKNSFDKDAVAKEINLQREVTQEFGRTLQGLNTEIERSLDGLKEKLAKGEIGRKEYEDGLKVRQRGKVLLNMIGAGLSAPTDSAAGIAAATASPAVSYQIGQYFKGLAQKNPDGRLTSGQETAHILAHGVLGAAVSAAGGNDALAGALASGGAEAAAPVIGKWLYGKGDGGSLSAEEKETVSAITRILGTTAGAAAGNSSADAVQGGMAADGAVGNNYAISIISKGRKVARVIQTGKKFTPKDALPIAEAGVVVAAICQITGNCNASEVLEDVWSGRFEDNYMASENADDANDKSANTQSNNGSQTTNAPTPDPDDEKQLTSSEQKEIRSLNKRIKEHKAKIEDFKKNPTIRPGMENLPKDIVKNAQERRILHLEREIKAFQKRIDAIKGK
uniref:VENN motif pre-toxin domain-containing protein n=1 Tax=Neisseria mucosa TaxID=488 RepID=UPI00280C055E